MTTPATTSPILPGHQRWFRLRKFLIRSFWITCLLAVGTVIWGLWYLNHRGFSREWRQAVIGELDKRGLHVTMRRLTLDPFRGLVAKEVRVISAREHGRTVAWINEIVLDLNYSNLVHGEQFLKGIDLRDATLSLPLDPGNAKGGQFAVSRLNARVLLPPNQLYIDHAEAEVYGLSVTATGRLANPEKFSAQHQKSGKEEAHPVAHQMQQSLRWLEKLRLAGGDPKLEIRFDGDLAQPSRLFAEAVFHAGKFTLNGDCRLQSAQITARYADGAVRLDQCSLKDETGGADLSGTFCPATGAMTLQLRSSLNLPALARAAGLAPELENCTFQEPPTIELDGEGIFAQGRFQGEIVGRASAGPLMIQQVALEGASADFSWAGERWYLHRARIRHRSGEMILSAMQLPGDFRCSLESRMNPKALLPLLSSYPQTLDTLEFQTPPLIQLEGRGSTPSLATLAISGSATLGASQYRGVAIKSVSVGLELKNNLLTCRDIRLERAEGIGTGTVMYDLGTDLLQFQNVRTTLVPTEVVGMFDQGVAEALLPYRFKTRPALVANGSIDCRKGETVRNHFKVEVDGAGGMDYTFLKRNLSSSKITGTVAILNDRVKIHGLEATLFGGTVRGEADISFLKAKGDYTASIRTEEVDFPSLTKLYFDYDTSKGKLAGSFDFSGRHDLTKEIVGTGALTVTDGNVFAIPIFGPFSGILNELVPGTGYNLARKGTCTFEMRDGIISTEDLAVDGKGFSMLGGGKLFILEDKIDFNIRLSVRGAAGMLFNPVGHLLEYAAQNPLSNPTWRLKRLPKVFGSHSPATQSAKPEPPSPEAPAAEPVH